VDFAILMLVLPVISFQLTMDQGSETGDMFAAHTALQKIYTPDVNLVKFPVCVAIKSVHNIPIENLWKWL
ncbi:hypothetical protein B0H15DRAFT_751007, partial [Mycena belliarum]